MWYVEFATVKRACKGGADEIDLSATISFFKCIKKGKQPGNETCSSVWNEVTPYEEKPESLLTKTSISLVSLRAFNIFITGQESVSNFI